MKPSGIIEMKHQTESRKFMEKKKAVFDQSDPGCVSADTEFLSPTGWIRIDQYNGQKVAQFHPETREIEFIQPLAYIKKPCDKMIAIAPTRGTSQRLSPEHRVLFYRRDGSHGVKSAEEFMNDLHEQGSYRHNAKFCTTYSVRHNDELDLTDLQIRLSVAVIADGHFQSETSNRCVIRLKKKRKIARLQELLLANKTQYDFRNCGGKDPAFKVFTFKAPLRDKEFGEWWWKASQRQLEIIADEVCYWDSSEDKRESNGTRFSTLSEKSADFIQYAFAAAKRPTSLTFAIRDRRQEDRGVSIEYNVHAQEDDKFVGPGRPNSVFVVNNPEGFKYCFEVPTSFLLLRHGGYIFATGNTGKTYVEIMDFAARHKKDKKAALVLCPKSLMHAAWFNDFKKFAPHLKVQLCYAEKRKESLYAKADVYVVNIDGVNDLAKISDTTFWKRFSTMIIDESTSVKHQNSKRASNTEKIRKHFEWVRLMSGTAASNGLCDLWHQYLILDGGKRLGKSFFQYRNSVCEAKQVGPSTKHLQWSDKPGMELCIAELVRDITIRHRFEDCIDIPPNHMYSVSFKLSETHMQKYEEMLNDQMTEIKGKLVTAVHASAVSKKLLQIASGAVYSGDKVSHKVASERYELTLDLVEARQHTVVFYLWKHQLEELVAEAKKRKISYCVWNSDTPELEAEYQAGKYQVMFAHPQSAAHGLTLTKGTATIWPSPTDNLEHFLQGLKRVYRNTQKSATETIVVLAENTYDEKVFARLQTKNMNLTSLLKELE